MPRRVSGVRDAKPRAAPVTGKPSAMQAPATKPSATEVAATEAPAAEPSATEAPAAEPSASEADAAEVAEAAEDVEAAADVAPDFTQAPPPAPISQPLEFTPAQSDALAALQEAAKITSPLPKLTGEHFVCFCVLFDHQQFDFACSTPFNLAEYFRALKGSIPIAVYHQHDATKRNLNLFADIIDPIPTGRVPSRTRGIRLLQDLVDLWVVFGAGSDPALLATLPPEAFAVIGSFALPERKTADAYNSCDDEDEGLALREVFAVYRGKQLMC